MNEPVVILSREGSIYGGMVVESALQAGLNVVGVVLQQWGTKQKYDRWRSYVRKHGLVTVAVSKAVEHLDERFFGRGTSPQSLPIEQVLSKYAVPSFLVPTLNGAKTITCLATLHPDLILLGGVGIVSAKVIDRASKGVLNAHQGIVPEYRGNYVVRWALLAGDPVGVTVHLVDASIDTGPVLSITQLRLPETRSLATIEHRVDQLRAELLAKEARRLLAGEINPVPQQSLAEYPVYSMLPPSKLLRTYRVLRQTVEHRGQEA